MATSSPAQDRAPDQASAGRSAADLLAGLALAGLLLPEAVAYASVAGMPPQAGLIALFAGLLCYGLIGTSRYAVVSATSSSAAVLAASSATIAHGDPAIRLLAAGAMVMLAGLLFIVAGAAKIGNLSDFIARPVLRGFSFGLAIVIILKQIAGVLGVQLAHGDMLRFTMALLKQAPHWNLGAAAAALTALGLLFLLGRVRRVPAALTVIVLGIAAGAWLQPADYGIGLVGPITLRLYAPTLPTLAYAQWLQAGELALALVLILYAESSASIRGFAMKHGDPVAPNRDLLALGVGNLLSGLFQGMPAGAGYSATAANEGAGASSRRAACYAALAILLIVLFVLPAVGLMPQPVLAAVVIHAVSHTLQPAIFRPAFTLHRDRLVIVASVASVLLLGVLEGLLAAMAVSLLMLLQRFALSSVSILGRLDNGHDFVSLDSHPQARPVAGVLILRPDSALFFANAERMLAQARRQLAVGGAAVHTVILSLEESPDLDSSSVEAIGAFCASVLAQQRQVLFARLKRPALHLLERAAIPGLVAGAMGELSVDDAVALACQLQAGTANGA